MPCTVVCYMRVDADEPEVFRCMKDAEAEAEQLREMQPENLYVVEECDENGKDV